MKGMRIFAALLATVFIVLGFLVSGGVMELFGPALFLSGSIILSAILISSAILESKEE